MSADESAPRFTPRQWLLLGILAAVQFANVLDFMIVMPLGPLLSQQLHLNPSQFGVIVASYAFAAGLAGLYAATIIDRFDRKAALIFLLLGFTLGTFACGLAWDYPSLLVARIVTGIFGGVMGAVTLAIVGDSFPPERRGTAMGIVMAAFSVATVAGIPAGLQSSELFQRWQVPFLGLAAFCVPVLPLAWFGMPPMRGHLDGRRTGPNLLPILTNRRYLGAFALMTFLMMGGFMVVPYITVYIAGTVHLPRSQVSWIYLFGGVATFVSMPIIGRLADAYGKQRMFVICALLSTVPILVLTHLPEVSLPVIVVVTTAFMVLMSGRGVPAMALIAGVAEPRDRGGFLSVNAAVQQLACGMAASLSAAILYTPRGKTELHGFDTVGYLAAGATLVSVALIGQLQPAAVALPSVTLEPAAGLETV